MISTIVFLKFQSKVAGDFVLVTANEFALESAFPSAGCLFSDLYLALDYDFQ